MAVCHACFSCQLVGGQIIQSGGRQFAFLKMLWHKMWTLSTFSLLNYSFCCSYLSIWRPDSDQCHEVLTIEIAGSVCLQAEWDVFLRNNSRSLCSAAFAEGRSSREKRRGQKEKLLRAKEEIQGQEESRRGEQGEWGEACSTEKREQRRKIIIWFCIYPETEGLPREVQAVGHCAGKVWWTDAWCNALNNCFRTCVALLW